jgi:hypothetical protein
MCSEERLDKDPTRTKPLLVTREASAGKQCTYCYYLNTFQKWQNSITNLLAIAILVKFAFRSHQQHSTLLSVVVSHRGKQRKQETLDREHEIKQHHHHQRKAIS